VVGVKKVESEGRFWSAKRCRVPAHTKELSVVFVGHVACAAFAKSNLHFMPTIDVDNGELIERGVRRALATVMPKMANIPK